MIQSEFASASSDVSPHAVMPCPPRMQPIASGFSALIAAMSRPSWKPGATPRHPDDLAAEDLLRELRAVLRRRDRDARVGMQVVDVRGIHEAVHRGVDRRGCAALAVQAVVERGDHLVLAVEAGVDVHERAHAVEAQHRQARLGERAEVAAGALHPEQLDRLTGHRVGLGALGGGVAAGVVRVLRVGAEAIGARDQIGGSRVRHEGDPSVGSGAEVRVDASALESTDSGAAGVWRGFESGGRAARRAAMRSRDAASRGFFGPVQVAVPGAGLGERRRCRGRRRRACAAKCSPETRSSSTSPLIMSVGGKSARSSAVASPGIAGSGAPSTGPPR